MQRETITLETPRSKTKVEVKTYLTGREKRAITTAYFNDKLEVNSETRVVKGIDFNIINKAEEIAWNSIVVSIDGKTENIVNTILDMHSEDYEFIVKEVNKIANPSNSEEKKTS